MNQARSYCRIIKSLCKGAILPSEYQQVEYLENPVNTSAYIKTGYVPAERFIAIVKAQYLSATGLMALGCQNKSGDKISSYGIGGGDSNAGALTYRYANPHNDLTGYTWTMIKSYTNGEIVTLVEDWVTPIYKVNDSTSVPNDVFPTFNSREFVLFGRIAAADNTLQNNGNMRIYSAKIYDSSRTLVRDYIPCYRKSDNKPGVYELVSKTFLTNAGSGEFIVGSNV